MRRLLLLVLTLLMIMGLLISAPWAHAASDQPVTWSDMSSIDLRNVLGSTYASSNNLLESTVPDSALELVLRDVDVRINEEFHVPPAMKESVSFWLKIYTQHSTQHLVIFDSKHPSLVYEVMDFRELARTSKSLLLYEVVRNNRVKKTLDAYQVAFQRLSKKPHPKHPTREEAMILKVASRLPHKHSFKDLARSQRSQTGQRDNMVKGLLAAETFFPKMESMFLKMGIPVELTRLSLVESSFNINARSRSGAVGVWQFLLLSGKEYLLIDEKHQIDERLSPLKATVAAGKLLKRNYRILGDWSLAVTSYNHGLRHLPRLRKGSKDRARALGYFDLCSKKSPLGFASRNYYAEFLAVVHAEAYRKLYFGAAPPIPDRVVSTKFEKLKKMETMFAIAKRAGISLHQFRLLNPDVWSANNQVPKGFWVALPSEEDELTGLSKHIRAKVVRARPASKRAPSFALN